MRKALCGILLLLSTGCASVMPAAEKQRLLLSLYVSGSQGWIAGPDLKAYDGGLLILSHEGSDLLATAEGSALANLQSVVADPQWQQLLAHLAATHDVATMPEGDLSLAIRSDGGGGVLWTRFPVEDMPEALRPYLQRIDDIFRASFGSRYPFLLSSMRIVG